MRVRRSALVAAIVTTSIGVLSACGADNVDDPVGSDDKSTVAGMGDESLAGVRLDVRRDPG